jgi:nucleotide-binding universal stress UspA family protein
MFKSIAVAVDGSDMANRAVQIGAELAVLASAKFDLIYVVDSHHMQIPDDLQNLLEIEHIVAPMRRDVTSLADAPANLFKSINQASANSQRAVFELADFIVKQAKKDAQLVGVKAVETTVEIGNPADRILDFAKRHNCDLIISGRHGLNPFQSVFLGSTSNKLAQQSECCCLTVS